MKINIQITQRQEGYERKKDIKILKTMLVVNMIASSML